MPPLDGFVPVVGDGFTLQEDDELEGYEPEDGDDADEDGDVAETLSGEDAVVEE